MWNLHETLITTDQFAQTLVQDLDLPNRGSAAAEISKQIRTQLEEYAGVALHPLFHSVTHHAAAETTKPALSQLGSLTPGPNALSRADTPLANGQQPSTPSRPQPPSTPAVVQTMNGNVAATASPIVPDTDDFSPDDTYRCIINLSINLSSQVYTDKFEWSLLHPQEPPKHSRGRHALIWDCMANGCPR